VPAPAREPGAAWRRLGQWFRLPVPAALSGAAVAAALVLAVVHRAPPPAAVGLAPAGVSQATLEAVPDEEPVGLLGEEDPLEALELGEPPSAATANLELELRTAAAAAADEGSEPGTSPVEEVELMETEDLRAVARALRGRI
jgi:hypothetical protein